MSNERRPGVLGDFDPADYEGEARERWGDTEAFRESERRTASYTEADWEAIKAEADAINQAFLDHMAAGTPPTEPDVVETVERHRAHITRWFYDCSPEIHAGLGAMYVSDRRFTESIDKAGDGLAAYMAEAITARYR